MADVTTVTYALGVGGGLMLRPGICSPLTQGAGSFPRLKANYQQLAFRGRNVRKLKSGLLTKMFIYGSILTKEDLRT